MPHALTELSLKKALTTRRSKWRALSSTLRVHIHLARDTLGCQRSPAPAWQLGWSSLRAHTLCLSHQNAGIQLPLDVPFFLSTLLGLLTIMLGLPGLVQLQVAAADLVEQPGLLQGGFCQRDLLLPPGNVKNQGQFFPLKPYTQP